MILRSVALGVLFVISSSFSARGVSSDTLIVERPTLTCVGFHWEILGDRNNNATATVEYRIAGENDWHRGLNLMRTATDGYQFLSGSIFNLLPSTEYEAKLTLVDENGVDGPATTTVTFTTRGKPVLPEGGTAFHVYPEGFAGAKQNPLLHATDWREALLDPETTPLGPGDQVLLHAGEYTLSPDLSAVTRRPVEDIQMSPKPSLPSDPVVWHVYHPSYDGPKEEPAIPLYNYGPPQIIRAAYKHGMKSGDIVMFHEGIYKVNRNNYRDRIFQGPVWGVYRLWHQSEQGIPLKIMAAEGENVVLDGDGSYALFEVTGADHMWIDGFTFKNTHCAIVAGQEPLGTCDGLTVTNCTFDNVEMPIYSDGALVDWHLSDNTGLDYVHTGPWHEAFGCIPVRVNGTAESPIVFRPAGDGDVTIDGGNNYVVFDVMNSNHVWFDQLRIQNTECAFLPGYSPFQIATDGLTITNCRVEDVRMGVYCDESTGEGWYIADNYFTGRNTRTFMNDHTAPFGIVPCGRGHVVTNNRVAWFQDGIDLGWWDRETSYDENDFTASVDVCRNIIYGCGDDFLEMDGSYFNGRAFENMMINGGAKCISTQATPAGPYYFIRNIVYRRRSTATFKLPSNIIAYHNTFDSNLENVGSCRYANNLFVYAPGCGKKGEETYAVKISNIDRDPRFYSDYNGIRYIADEMFFKPYLFDDQEYATLEEFSAATGYEENSVTVPGFAELFQNVPEPTKDTLYEPENVDFRLREGVVAIDAGVELPNINEGYRGSAPDLGAIEYGEGGPHYGPRPESSSTTLDDGPTGPDSPEGVFSKGITAGLQAGAAE